MTFNIDWTDWHSVDWFDSAACLNKKAIFYSLLRQMTWFFFYVVFAIVRFAMGRHCCAHLDAWLFHVFDDLFVTEALPRYWIRRRLVYCKKVNKHLKDSKYLLTQSPFHKLWNIARQTGSPYTNDGLFSDVFFFSTFDWEFFLANWEKRYYLALGMGPKFGPKLSRKGTLIFYKNSIKTSQYKINVNRTEYFFIVKHMCI